LTSERLRFAESIREAWKSFDTAERSNARKALARIEEDPISGVPLADPVKGYWSAREGAIRVVYRLMPQTGVVVVLRIVKVRGRERR